MAQAYREGKVLLCINDSPAILRYQKTLFERAGFVVVTAVSAQEGLRVAALCQFDAVLLDYELPDADGRLFAIEMRRLQPSAPLIMFSGRELPSETHRVINAFVPKAGLSSELLPTIRRLLDLDWRREAGASNNFAS